MARSDAFGWPQRLRFRNRALSRTRLAPAKHSRPARQLAPKRLVRPARGCSPAASQAKASKGDGHARPDTRSEFLHASGRITLPDALDRKSVVEGKSVSVRVDLGCGITIKKKQTKTN